MVLFIRLETSVFARFEIAYVDASWSTRELLSEIVLDLRSRLRFFLHPYLTADIYSNTAILCGETCVLRTSRWKTGFFKHISQLLKLQ